MDIEMLLKRQEVLAWRDALVLNIWRIVNRAGTATKREVEAQLAEAGLVGTLWDPDKFARDRVDDAMRAGVTGDLETLFAAAAQELRCIDDDYSALADALLGSLDLLRLPQVEGPADPAAPHSPSAPAPSGRLAGVMAAVSRQGLVKSAREWGGRALDMVGEASDVASQKLQSGAGLHDRLRRSAQARIDTAWMAPVGDPPPLMGQLLSAVETVGNQARSMAR